MVQPLPPTGRLIAVALGSGNDDHLGVVLVIRESGYVVWGWDARVQIEQGAGHGFYSGYYYDFCHDANRAYTANRAWNRFAQEARNYALAAQRWDSLAQQEAEHVAAAEQAEEDRLSAEIHNEVVRHIQEAHDASL